MPKYPLLDTNVFISGKYSASIFDKMYFSSVVLYELIAANIDEATFKYYASWRKQYPERIITPNATDWFECSKLIRNMLRGEKSQTKGRVQKTTSAQQQQNDALIARTAWRHDCFVVTNNERDFHKFEPYMKGLDIVPADYFFDN